MLPPKPRLRINSEDLVDEGPPSSIVSSNTTTPSLPHPLSITSSNNSLNNVDNKNSTIFVLDANSINITTL